MKEKDSKKKRGFLLDFCLFALIYFDNLLYNIA